MQVEQIQGPMAQLTVVQFANSDPNMIENLHWSIDWSEFSLTKLPTATSHVVLRERNDLQSSVNFQVLASDFRMLDVLVRDASQEISNCCNFGDANLQSHVQGITSEVSGLISKSGLTVGSFKSTTYTALRYLEAAFLSIINDDSKKAIEGLQKVSELAERMAKQSAELQKDSDKDTESSQKVLEEVLTAQRVAKQRKAALEKNQRELEISKRGLEELARKAQENEIKAKEMAREADIAAAYASRKKKKRRKRLKHHLGKLVGHDDSKKYRDRERVAREEARKFNEQRQAHQNTVTQAEREIQEMESAIRNLQSDANRAVDALQKLIGTFKSLSATTHKVVGVWERLKLLCEYLQNSLLKKDVEEVAPDSPADREAVWSSPCFQANAVQLYSRWLALQEELLTSLKPDQAQGALRLD